MNTNYWINQFEQSHAYTATFTLPQVPCTLPEVIRKPVAISLAIFQLGETGGGTRLRRYACVIAPTANFRGYERAIDLFIQEEQSHGALLAKVVTHLRGTMLTKQWTNSIFRWLRVLVNLEFNIQVLLTAEIIAEVYYGSLYLHCDDAVVRAAAHKILRDEMKHLAFQRDFLGERIASFTALGRWLWRLQFQALLHITAAVVAWDHRRCFTALGIKPVSFMQRCLAAGSRFTARLDSLLFKSATTAARERSALGACQIESHDPSSSSWHWRK